MLRHRTSVPSRAHARRSIEIPIVRVTLAPTSDLDDHRGRSIRTHADAAAVLTPFLDTRHASRRLAVALADHRDRLRAVALFDGDLDSACCLRPSDLAEALIVSGSQRAWLAHRHRPRQRLHIVRQDLESLEGAQRLIAPLGLAVRDHLIVGTQRYASLVEASAKPGLWWDLRRRIPFIPRDPHALPSPRARATVPRAPRSRHVAFTLVGPRTLRHDLHAVRVPRRPEVDTPEDAASLLVPLLEKTPWVAALLDRDAHLIAVAHIDSKRGHECVIDGTDVYRAAITLDAARVVLAHRHASPRASPTDDHLRTAHDVYSVGFELGRELCDLLVFGPDGKCASLRALGAGVPHWRESVDTRNPSHPAERLRRHQIRVNRRPTARHTRHAAAARAALWRCPKCKRRQNYKRACRYCGAPRPTPETNR